MHVLAWQHGTAMQSTSCEKHMLHSTSWLLSCDDSAVAARLLSSLFDDDDDDDDDAASADESNARLAMVCGFLTVGGGGGFAGELGSGVATRLLSGT
jgi:hypothetical protein